MFSVVEGGGIIRSSKEEGASGVPEYKRFTGVSSYVVCWYRLIGMAVPDLEG